jgi:hypothetical protein
VASIFWSPEKNARRARELRLRRLRLPIADCRLPIGGAIPGWQLAIADPATDSGSGRALRRLARALGTSIPKQP